MSNFKCPEGESNVMLFFPDKKAAEKFSNCFREPYKLAVVLYQIPVILTEYYNDVLSYIDYNHEENYMISEVNSTYPFPIFLEESKKTWLSCFDFIDKSGLAYILDLDFEASELLNKRKISLDECPDETKWEAIRIMYYSLKNVVPIQPSFYPSTIALDPESVTFPSL